MPQTVKYVFSLWQKVSKERSSPWMCRKTVPKAWSVCCLYLIT